MKNIHLWQPTKYAFTSKTGSVSAIGANKRSGGSLLAITLVGRWYSRNIQPYVHGRILDLGCGTAPLYAAYKEFAKEVLCTDWPTSLHNNEFLDFASDLNFGIPLSDQTIDTVIMSDVMEHLYRPLFVLKEIRRVLKPGGHLILNVPFLYWIHEQPHDYFRYTQFAISRLAAEAEFQVEILDTIGGPLLSIADIVGKIVQSIPLFGSWIAAWMQRVVLLFCDEVPSSQRFPIVIAAVLTPAKGLKATNG